MKKITYINAESSGSETGAKVKRRAVNQVTDGHHYSEKQVLTEEPQSGNGGPGTVSILAMGLDERKKEDKRERELDPGT